MRRRLEKDAKEARYLAQQLRKKQEAKKRWNLEQRLRDFSSKYKGPTLVVVGRGGSGRELDLAAPAVEDLDELASLLKEAAAACKDRGGPTRNMEAFDVLAEGLIGAYHRATGRKGTGGNVREAGRRSRERELVEDVLLTANELAIAVTGKPLKAPAIGFLGDRLEEIAKRLLKRAKPPKSNR